MKHRIVLAALAIATAILSAPTAIAEVTAIYWTDRDNATLSRNNMQGMNTLLAGPTGGRLQDVDLDPTTSTL